MPRWDLIALGIVLVSRLVVSYPLDNKLVGGVDFVGTVQPIWFVSAFWDAGWDQFWYAGYPVLKLNSPFLYLLGAAFATVTNPVIATKLLADVFFLLAPVVFFVFVRQLGLSERGRAVAISVFSFFPSFIYFFWSNNIPTTVSLVFALLSWVSLDRYLNSNRGRDGAFAILFLCITILTHQLTALLNMILLASWSFARYRRVPLLVFAGAVAISSFWLGPFLLEYSEGETLKTVEGNITFFNSVVAYIGTLPTVFMIIILAAFVSLSIISRKTKDVIPLTTVLLVSSVLLVLFPYTRVISLMPIPLAALAGILSRARFNMLAMIVVILFFTAIFFSFEGFFYLSSRPDGFPVPAADSRVIYYPMEDVCTKNGCAGSYYTSYIPLLYGQEVVWGFRDQFLKQVPGRNEYFWSLYKPLDYSHEKTYELLEKGYIKNVIVQKSHQDFVRYFSSSAFFEKVAEDENFIVFSVKPEPSFVEIDGTDVQAELQRGKNKITLDMNCSRGTVTIKESFDSWWEAKIDGAKIGITPNEIGFMKIRSDRDGFCTIEMSYKMPVAYYAFPVISMAGLALVTFYFRKK